MKLCPFKNHKCRQCHRIGHKEGYCSSDKRQSKHRGVKAKRQSQSQVKSTFATFKVGFQSKRKYVNLLVNEKPIRLQLDTASDITLISKNTWRKLGCPRIRPTEHVARNASGDIVKLTGEVTCNVQFKGHKFTDVCYLTNRHDLDLLGLDWIEKIDVLNGLLNEVCSHNSCSDSIQNSHDISKPNASGVLCSPDVYELNASDVTCSRNISESHSSDLMCSHHDVKSNTSDLLCSHYDVKSNTSDLMCSHNDAESNNSDVTCSQNVSPSNSSNKVCCRDISKSHASYSSKMSTTSHGNHLRQKHAGVFQNKLGCCKFTKVFLSLKQNAKPIFRPKRPVHYAALSAVDHELDSFEALGVIQPVNHSNWAAPIIVVRKIRTQCNRHHGAKRRIYRRSRFSPSQKAEKPCSMGEIFLDSFVIGNSATRKTVKLQQHPNRRSRWKRKGPDAMQVDPKKGAYFSGGRYR